MKSRGGNVGARKGREAKGREGGDKRPVTMPVLMWLRRTLPTDTDNLGLPTEH